MTNPSAVGCKKRPEHLYTYLLTNWVDYLGKNRSMIPFDAMIFMKIVGVIEIIAGIIVLVKPLSDHKGLKSRMTTMGKNRRALKNFNLCPI